MMRKHAHKRHMPTPEEDAAINRGIEADEDTFEFDPARAVPEHELPAVVQRAIQRARLGRPRKANPKRSVSIRLAPEIIDFFKAGSPDGRGWQTRLHRALEEYVREHQA